MCAAGSAKFGVLRDATFALRVAPSSATPVTRALRTSPPPFVGGQGVTSLVYGGTYPLSRLRVLEPAFSPLSATLFAYSKFVPGNPSASSFPAIEFTMALSNPAAEAVSVAALFVLPFGAINDCQRAESQDSTVTNASSAADCLHRCADASSLSTSPSDPPCAAWNFHHASGACVLLSSVPLVSWAGKAY